MKKTLVSCSSEPEKNSIIFPLKVEESSLKNKLSLSDFVNKEKEDQFLRNIYFSLYDKLGDFCKITGRRSRSEKIEFFTSHGFKSLARTGLGHLEGTYFSSVGGAVPYQIFEKEELIVGIGTDLDFIFNYDNSDHKELIEKANTFIQKEDVRKDAQISLLVTDYGDLALKNFEMKPIKMDFGLYNNGFEDDYNFVVKFLKEDKPGIILLLGEPGAGKSSMIKTLLKTVKKKFVYIPAEMVGQLASPAFLSFAIDNLVNAILIVEDGDSILCTNHGERSPATTQLLNIGDGVLGDLLKCQIILTGNIEDTADNIDEAIVRPGRLKKKIRFEKLKKEKAQKWLDSKKVKAQINEDISLAELFNLGFDNGNKKKERRTMNLFAN